MEQRAAFKTTRGRTRPPAVSTNAQFSLGFRVFRCQSAPDAHTEAVGSGGIEFWRETFCFPSNWLWQQSSDLSCCVSIVTVAPQ